MLSAAETLSGMCMPGLGDEHFSANQSDIPALQSIAAQLGSFDPGCALLTPTQGKVCHPLQAEIKPGVLYRSSTDFRSFSMTTGVSSADTITIKGGDIPYMRPLQRDHGLSTVSRITSKEIPGAALLEDAQHESAMAIEIHRAALQHLGRLAFTAIPLRVNSIISVQDKLGAQIPLLDYLNSSDYLEIPSWLSSTLPAGLGTGDILLKHLGLQPAEYTYATVGHNIRVDTLLNARHFRTYDTHSGEFRGIDDMLWEDPLDRKEAVMGVFGDWIPRSPNRKNTVFRNTYSLLADAYDFDPCDALPSAPITDANYMHMLRLIPELCAERGIANRVIHSFTERVTEVMALLHAQGLIFSHYEGIGSSFMPRNVTYNGVVLDLDTVGVPTRSSESHIERDLAEAVLAIASMRRIVSPRPLDNLPDFIRGKYLEQLDQFGIKANSKRDIVNMLGRSSYLSRMEALL